MTGSRDGVALDVLVVGGGVQGLVLLNQLKQHGYSAALVTNADLGSGQTLHAHGILNSGYPMPRKELRASLKEDWLPFAERSGLQLYGDDHSFILAPATMAAQLRRSWDEFGYEHEAATPTALPAGFREGALLENGAELEKIREYTYPKRQLVRLLSEGVEDRILRGRIAVCRWVRRGGGAGVDSVEVRLEPSGRTVSFKPSFLIGAAGTGTKGLLRSLAGEPSFVAAGGTPEQIEAQAGMVACRKSHMICIRAPEGELPAVNLLLPEHGLILVSALVDRWHDRTGDILTWYVTPADPNVQPADNVPDSAEAEVEPRLVGAGIGRLLSIFPSLKAKAEREKSNIEFTVFAGYKQDIGEEKNKPVCRLLAGTDNAMIALPSVVGGAFLAAKEAVKTLSARRKPSGALSAVPGAGEGVRIGQVNENTAATKWMAWREFESAFPLERS